MQEKALQVPEHEPARAAECGQLILELAWPLVGRASGGYQNGVGGVSEPTAKSF